MRRKCVQPGENGGLLPQVTPRIAPDSRIVRNIWLLEGVTSAHEQQFDCVLRSGVPIKLSGSSKALAQNIMFVRLGRIEKPAGGKPVHEKVVAEPPVLAAVVGVEI